MTEDEVGQKRGRSSPPNGEKKSRRSRFEPASTTSSTVPDASTTSHGVAGVASASALAAARAMKITRALLTSEEQREKALKEERARAIQAQIAAQMQNVSSLLANAQKEKKPTYRPLLLDSLGREVDEEGKLVVNDIQVVKTLAANTAASKAKKENPYLAHRVKTEVIVDDGDEKDEKTVDPLVDPRLKNSSSRDYRAKKSFNFVEEGTYVREADKIRKKEERKVIAGYSSGRKRPDQEGDDEEEKTETDNPHDDDDIAKIYGGGDMKTADENTEKNITVPPPSDGGIVPAMEWWDECFLPKQTRDLRRRSKAAQQHDDSELLNAENCRTLKYIQHPVPIKPLGGEKEPEPLKMYLTKKERKRIRRTTRHEREMEKRDKIMMGLIPPPEPKFKLSNFMKILGDQAVSDPSKVEKRVMQQMQQRVLNHEMRNAARKLTPAQRREKKKKKLQEDTSRQVDVAIFRVKDFSDPKHRFKVDVNMQQLNLTGTVLLCPAANTNLVVAEGGPKGIKKLVHLMTNRVAWTKSSEDITKRGGASGAGKSKSSAPLGLEFYGRPEYPGADKEQKENEEQEEEINEDSGAAEMEEEEEKEEEDGDEINDDDLEELHLNSDKSNNRCDLLWQGILPKRTFHALRFQECRSATAARKVLEAKGVAHYWDMAMRADDIISSK